MQQVHTADKESAGLRDGVWSGQLARVLAVIPLLYGAHLQVVRVTVTLHRHALPVRVHAPVGRYDTSSVQPEHDQVARYHSHASTQLDLATWLRQLTSFE